MDTPQTAIPDSVFVRPQEDLDRHRENVGLVKAMFEQMVVMEEARLAIKMKLFALWSREPRFPSVETLLGSFGVHTPDWLRDDADIRKFATAMGHGNTERAL